MSSASFHGRWPIFSHSNYKGELAHIFKVGRRISKIIHHFVAQHLLHDYLVYPISFPQKLHISIFRYFFQIDIWTRPIYRVKER